MMEIFVRRIGRKFSVTRRLLLAGSMLVITFLVAISASDNTVRGVWVAFLHLGMLMIMAAAFYHFYRKRRLLPANLTLLIFLVYAVEVFFFALSGMPALTLSGLPPPEGAPGSEERCLGYLPEADTTIHRVTIIEGDTVCDIHLTTDRFHKRVTPGWDAGKQKFALFFGCSIVFGEGVEDEESMPCYFQQLSGEYNAYNYGANGHATNHVLARFYCSGLREQVPENEGVGFYIFFWDHLWRAIGSMNRYMAWMSNAPYFRISHGELIHDGSFREGRALRSGIYRLLYHSATVKYFDTDIPLKLRKRHVELVARMVAESRNQFKKQFGTEQFYFVYYPEWGEPDKQLREHLNACLKRHGIQIIDLSAGGYHQEMTLGWDPHPSPATHQRMAGDLLQHYCAMNKKH